jgi:alanyl-tRNA synthetase
MKKLSSKEIRQAFFDFFKSKDHKIVPSAPIVLKDDPTLMFTNAGMNQFKEYFLDYKKPEYKRIADTQKCLRVSGKHNDLEEVGLDTYHHTMFEMLGNWSFGDYFKKEAIAWAWELLTEVYKIDKDRIYVTVFEGDSKEQLEKDMEAYDLWKEWVDEDRILFGNKKDNFWEMGATGPCGPSSEIHVDLRSDEERKKIPGKDLVNKDHPEVIEIWNLVFMEFNRKANGSLEKLSQKHVDTGMGFERLTMVIQGKKSNYDTDIFMPLIHKIEKISGYKYGEDEKRDIAMRVVADHVRAVAFSIADGQLPSNTGAGYVIRRILRRAIRYGFTFLDLKKPFIYQLVPALSEIMGDTFPELFKQKGLITNVIKEEEQSFLKTLEQGLILLNRIMETAPGKKIPGAKVFELYDTFGFPKDLTALILREKGYEFDEKEFDTEMQKQKQRSKAASQIETDDWVVLREDDEEEFVGYDTLKTPVKITKYRKVKSKKDGELYQLVFNLTPFYPESGGQVGDRGYLEAPNGDIIHILDTKKENNLIVHISKNLPKNPSETFMAVVDEESRKKTMANHSATHLMHQALREILGTHVEQKGSQVSPTHLRFDFSHFGKMSDEEIKKVEDFVNERIAEKLPLIEKRNIPIEEALKEGAMALFGEKYGDSVRTIRFGDHTELCGGTHVENTADIWQFKILSESAIASGIRRIEAITGEAVKDYYKQQDQELSKIKKLLKNPSDLYKAIESLQKDNVLFKKEIEKLQKEKAKTIQKQLNSEFEKLGDALFLAKKLDLEPDVIKNILFSLGKENENIIGIIGTQNGEKAIISLYISKSLAEKYNLNAGQIIREAAKEIQGGGGGQVFFATAGGKNIQGLNNALNKAKEIISEKIKHS